MRKSYKSLTLFLFVFCLLFANVLTGGNIAKAAKDTKKPTITLTPSVTKATNKTISVSFKATDASGISLVKWAKGSQKESYFKSKGTTVKLTKSVAKVSIKENGTYTFYAKDKAGNVRTKKITISNIDKTAPTLTLKPSTTKATSKSVKVSVTVSDDSGIASVKYLSGKKETKDFDKSGTAISISKNKGSFTAKKNGNYTVLVTDKVGNKTLKTVKISNIDTISPELTLSYSVYNQVATIAAKAIDKESGVTKISYLKGNVKDVSSEKWASSKDITHESKINVKTSGKHSILVTDGAGNKTVKQIDITLELRAVWVSYLEFITKDYSQKAFETKIDTMFDKIDSMNMNAVIVQVRPFSDAMYKSSYFPWSSYASGTQGVNPGFDPMKYMIEAAHKRDLEFHAWLNPYRVTLSSTDYSKLSSDNPARKWKDDNNTENDRNVLSFGGNLYYNPASKDVQKLIVNGVKEIVQNYDVDGIHFDDYFYPTLGTKYKTTFDNVEYEAYEKECKDSGKTALTIDNWRRNNVNTLVKSVYSAIKKIDSTVQFGISPAGNISNLTANDRYYVDVKTWMSSSNYIDYIAPQIYWTFSHSTCPFDKTVDEWLALRTSKTVNVYIGIANYRAGSDLESEWKNSDDVLKRQVEYGRGTGKVDGYMFFRYDFFLNKVCEPEVNNLLSVLK